MVNRLEGNFSSQAILGILRELQQLDSKGVRFFVHNDAERRELGQSEMEQIVRTNELPLTDKDAYEFRVEVQPSDESYCEFTIAFGRAGTYDIHIGHGLHMDEIRESDTSPLSLIHAVLSGRVTKTIWTIGPILIQSKGSVNLQDGRALNDKSVGLLSFLAKQRQISYLPYPKK